MNRSAMTLITTILLAACVLVPVASGQGISRHKLLTLDRAAFRARPMAMMPADQTSGVTIVYGDRYGILRVVRITDNGAQELWRSRALEGGPVVEVLVEDLDGNGGSDIIARTQDGRVYVYDEFYSSRWESVNEDFRTISAMTIGNVDGDSNYELILFADRRIYYIDGAQFTREYESTQVYSGQATEILLGNVDTDLDLELVTNFGAVIDVVTGEPEWEAGNFGQFIELVDIDGDGLQEIIGYSTGLQPFRIYDADEQREKPLQ